MYSLLFKTLYIGSVFFKGLIDECGGTLGQLWGQHCQSLRILFPSSSKEAKSLIKESIPDSNAALLIAFPPDYIKSITYNNTLAQLHAAFSV